MGRERDIDESYISRLREVEKVLRTKITLLEAQKALAEKGLQEAYDLLNRIEEELEKHGPSS